MKKYLNLGCSEKYVVDKSWVNIDFVASENVLGMNILKGLPYENDSVDGVFSSCMLEHFSKTQAEDHIKECYRVLRKGGILRVVVPDLEDVCREYLNMLDNVRNNISYESRYDYIVIELIDQMTRMEPGGEMLKYWQSDTKDEEYIKERTGYPAGYNESNSGYESKKLGDRVKRTLSAWKEKMQKGTVKKCGEYALSGEQHKWMYDSFSLIRLYERTGFSGVEKMNYNESRIENWKEYALELDEEGMEYKPHSIYIEGIKLASGYWR